MKIINCTPHPIDIISTGGKKTILVSGILPRLQEQVTATDLMVEGVAITEKSFCRVEGLPEKKDGVFLVVSSLVAQAANRSDLIVPELCRDESGKIIGCSGFFRVKNSEVEDLKNKIHKAEKKLVALKRGGKSYRIL